MKEESKIYRLLIKILKKIGIIIEEEVDKSVMCKKAVEGVCQNNCECAWSIGVTKQNYT